jgi:hypothetical protein
MMTAGYSGKPLAQKLGFKQGHRIYLIDAPDNYLSLVAPLPSDVEFVKKLNPTIDLVHIFSIEKNSLAKHLQKLRLTLSPEAALWVSWPKKAAKLATDITEDTIRELALPLGFVDIKVCAVSDVWSGLKLVVRKELR